MAGFGVVILMSIFAFIFYLILFGLVWLIISYIFESIAIMTFRKNKGNITSCIAWIPFYNKYLLGEISNNHVMGGVLFVINLLIVGLGILWLYTNESICLILLLILGVTSFLLNTIISSNIFRKYSKCNVVCTVISIITFGILRPIFLFAIRNNELVDHEDNKS